VGGSARTWETRLPANVVASSAIRLRLVMTKFGPPAVTIGYSVSLGP
jgi:hypothetical protein